MNLNQTLGNSDQSKLPAVSLHNFEGNELDISRQTDGIFIAVPALANIGTVLKVTLYCIGTDANGAEIIATLREPGTITSSEANNTSTYELPLDTLKDCAHNSELKIILRADTITEQNSDLINHSVSRFRIQNTPSPSLIEAKPNVNYKRWMTDILPDIANLKIHELAWPGLHNAGVDMESTELSDELWGACQDDTFWWQLEHGGRVLDLRVKDVTEQNGGKNIFWFYHGIITGERRLVDCVSEINSFLTSNPDEIVILDIHETRPDFDGQFRTDVFISQLNPLFDKLIPSSASNLTVTQIREQHPKKNVIIAWNGGSAHGFWPTINHKWIGQDTISPEELFDFVKETMKSPPENVLWSLSNAAYSWWTGPVRFPSTHVCMQVPFFSGNKPNIVNVDFIADTGTVDNCINHNKSLGQSRNTLIKQV